MEPQSANIQNNFGDWLSSYRKSTWRDQLSSAGKLIPRILPYFARLLLLGTFIEDGIRVAIQANDQHRYLAVSWTSKKEWPLGWAIVVLCSLGQLIPSLLILFRLAVVRNCIALLAMILIHTVAYQVHLDLRFLAQNVAVCGGILLLIAEQQSTWLAKRVAVPSGALQPEPVVDKMFSSRSMLLLTGRVLVLLMFASIIRIDFGSIVRMVEMVVATILFAFIIVGFKAKWSALGLAGWLFALNLVVNAWWKIPAAHPYREFAKYDFFQTLAVIGGLLLVFSQGPGQLSVDERNKKQW